MKRERIYIISIILLIMLNIWLVIYIAKSAHEPHQRPPKLTSWLHVEGKLKDKIDALEQRHFEQKDRLMDKNMSLHNDLFELVVSEKCNDSLLQNKLSEIGRLQQDIERMTAFYFRDIYSVCNAEQRSRLKHEIKRVLIRIGAPPKRH
jgi:hypothetical protein